MHHRTVILAAAAVLALPLASRALDAPTFNHDVAPILYANCAGCHAPGQIGPMSLRSYDEVRPWAKSIAKALEDRAMPPWHADPGYGPWKNDRSLAPQEIDTVLRWVKAGAPRGEGEAPEPPEVVVADEWALGEPDVILQIDPVEIAADGPDQFVQKPIPTGFDSDRFVTAIEILPGNRQVVHHVLLWMANESGTAPQAMLGGWAAGATPNVMPEGTGRLVKKGHPLIFDMHYHPYGVATTDRTRIGLHLAKEQPIEKELVNLWVLNADFEIPAGADNVEATSSHTFAQDVRLLALTPHMHYRGKDFSFTAVLPDGTSKELLKVSRYDFNWQTAYDFAEPVDLPAGSRVDCVAHWDNSTDNPANPDPQKTVTWGVQSTDEMMIGFVDYVVKDGVSPRPVSPLLGKLPELAQKHPGEVWRVDVQTQPGKGPEPTAVHLPKQGNGGWYVAMGNMVLPAPIHSIVWDGNKVTAEADIPGQGTVAMSGTVGDDGDIDLTMGPGTIHGTAAEKAARQSIPSGR